MEEKKNVHENSKKKGVKETVKNGFNTIKNGVCDATDWISDNWVTLSIAAAGITGFASKWADIYSKIKGTNTRRRNYQQREDSRLRYHDRHTGDTFYLVRPLTNRETIILQTRIHRGEYAGDILDSMGLLRW